MNQPHASAVRHENQSAAGAPRSGYRRRRINPTSATDTTKRPSRR